MEYGPEGLIDDPVLIDLASNLFPGMKILSCLLYPFDRNVRRKEAI